MKSTVVIKSNKSGMTVILAPEVPFEQLLQDIASKFEDSAKFWGAVQMTLTLTGRPLTPEQEFQIANVIMEHSQIEILCLVDLDSNRTKRCEKALNEKLMELSSATGQFYRGCLKKGEALESEASIVVIGDVEPGARVTARGNVIVLGELKGTVVAGAAGNEDAVVVALTMAPFQIKIAGCTGKTNEKSRRLGRGAMCAGIDGGEIHLSPIKKSFFHVLKSI
ncbi:MAG: septum site-determining protein MinC [Hungatella sp.]|nr:septum site-determining protein MinC [Hungatella sp.]